MSSDFVELTVSDVAAPIKNALVGGPFGSNLVSKDYTESGVPVIRGQNMGHGIWVSGEFAFVSEEKAESLAANTARPGDLVFTQRGTLGQVAIVPEGPYEKYIVSQSQMKLTVDTRKADVLFLYYLFMSPEQQRYIQTNAIQVGVPHTNLGILRDTPISLPDLETQKEIAKLLGSLDDKIELNRQINQTLEQIAQAIFKSWFVDFEPVKAKIEAKQNGQDPERAAMCAISGKTDEEIDALTPEQRQQLTTIAAHFPDELEEPELGEIPKGWSVSEIGDMADVIDCLHAKKPEIVNENTGNIFLQLKNISDDGLLLLDEIFYVSDEDYKKWISRIEAKEGDCVITNVGRVGAVAQIPRSIKAALGRNMTAIRCREDSYYPTFLITLLTSPYLKREIELRTDVGTILNALNVKNIPKLRFANPGPLLLKEFESYMYPLQRTREINIEENRTLGIARETLLPKLLSGEITLGEAEPAAEEVA